MTTDIPFKNLVENEREKVYRKILTILARDRYKESLITLGLKIRSERHELDIIENFMKS
jgi:hypothetical protein